MKFWTTVMMPPRLLCSVDTSLTWHVSPSVHVDASDLDAKRYFRSFRKVDGDAAGELDTVEHIEVAWIVGDERPEVGRAVLQHLMHLAAGPCLTWENGGQVTHESFVGTGTLPMGGGLGGLTASEFHLRLMCLLGSPAAHALGNSTIAKLRDQCIDRLTRPAE
ncbi:hypothetical protein [Nocardia sp. NPDC052112]|uniref:hypothetical protein n=1 Tax=Nocardia sp. NPDC052112 TaxID=3155646 RepID=UPI003419CD2C